MRPERDTSHDYLLKQPTVSYDQAALILGIARATVLSYCAQMILLKPDNGLRKQLDGGLVTTESMVDFIRQRELKLARTNLYGPTRYVMRRRDRKRVEAYFAKRKSVAL